MRGPDATPHPRRSYLYVPGANTRALEKCLELPADGVILDLEDAVAPDAKQSARANVAAALAAGGFGHREVLVRVNGPDTPWHADDLKVAASSDGVLLPKVEAAQIIQRASAALGGACPLWCMIETPLGVLRVAEIAASGRPLAGLVMGTSDLTADLRARHRPDRLPLLASLGQCVLAARAYGLAIIDGVHLDLKDEDGFRAACRQGRDMGFDGKSLIHPRTIAIANETFGPDEREVAQARRVIAAFEEAEAQGLGVAVLDGRLIEALHVREARRILAVAGAIEEREAG